MLCFCGNKLYCREGEGMELKWMLGTISQEREEQKRGQMMSGESENMGDIDQSLFLRSLQHK